MGRPKARYTRFCMKCRSITTDRSQWGEHHSRGYCRKHYDEWKNDDSKHPFCQQAGCTVRIGLRPHDSRQGFCRLHDWQLLGEPHRKPEAIERTREKFVASIASTTNDRGCWLWEGRSNPKEYGLINVGNHDWLAHRYSYGSFVGGHRPQLTLDHVCRIRNCVRPDHLMPVTRLRNNALEHADTDDLDTILRDLCLLPDMQPGTMLWAMVKGLAVGRAQPGGEPFPFGKDGQPFEHELGPAVYPSAKLLLKA
jgi:hypothetical protein